MIVFHQRIVLDPLHTSAIDKSGTFLISLQNFNKSGQSVGSPPPAISKYILDLLNFNL